MGTMVFSNNPSELYVNGMQFVCFRNWLVSIIKKISSWTIFNPLNNKIFVVSTCLCVFFIESNDQCMQTLTFN